MKNYNTLLRKTIVNDIETIITKKFKSLHEAVMIYQQSLYPLIDNNKPESKVVISCLMGLVYADSYKYFSYKQKNMNNMVQHVMKQSNPINETGNEIDNNIHYTRNSK